MYDMETLWNNDCRFNFYSGKLMMQNELDINNFSFLAAMMLGISQLDHFDFKYGSKPLICSIQILPIIDNKNKIKDEKEAKTLTVKDAKINFKDVKFSYDVDQNIVLKEIDLEFAGGKMTSLVGNSGSGKSTILNLIPRFYDTNSGDITIDDQSIYKTKIQSLRNNISLVSQETTLFDDTIKNNIKYANIDANDEEILRVAKLSYCDEFIELLPQKYDTIIGENGVRLSGGEKQRISIARAMMKKSSIILLDEATSSLDSDTESKIQNALSVLTKDRTTIVIAHRLSTILNSNNIYVIDAGRVVASGKHKELLENSKLYKNFYEKQIQK